jgi:hypothetical protein
VTAVESSKARREAIGVQRRRRSGIDMHGGDVALRVQIDGLGGAPPKKLALS